MIVAWEQREGRRFEPDTTAWMIEAVAKADGLFVDVGASTGWFAVAFAKMGHEVVAFEPNPNALGRLRQNMALNDVTFRVIEAAASNNAGTAIMYHNPMVPLTSGASIEAPTCARPARWMVPTVRIDDEVTAPVALMKIDVEGHELAVLAGAAGIIAAHRPHLMLEANTPNHVRALSAWLDNNGYDWVEADDRNMLCSPSS